MQIAPPSIPISGSIEGEDPISPDIPALEYPGGLWRHAVHTPVREPVGVADGDGEAAVIGPDDPDGLPRGGVARDRQVGVLASICRLVFSAVGALAWKIIREKGIF